jgi:hypothetical protein
VGLVERLVRRPGDLVKTPQSEKLDGAGVCLILDPVFATGPVRRRVGFHAGVPVGIKGESENVKHHPRASNLNSFILVRRVYLCDR